MNVTIDLIALHDLLTIAEATVTLTAPSSPPCFDQTFKLTCTHPVLQPQTDIGWERNGTGFNPQSNPNYDLMDVTDPSTTTLTITVTREEFENKVFVYRCLTFDVTRGTSDPNRVISNEVTVDPPGESESLLFLIIEIQILVYVHMYCT